MKYFFSSLLALSFIVSMTACSSVEIVRVTDDNRNSIEGLRFYRPVPYLLVTESAQAKKSKENTAASEYTYQIKYLPDKSEEYAIQTRYRFGSLKNSYKLEDGWNLTLVDVNADQKIPETIAAVGDLAASIAKAVTTLKLSPSATEEITVPPGLYSIEFDKKTGLVTRLVRVKVSVSD